MNTALEHELDLLILNRRGCDIRRVELSLSASLDQVQSAAIDLILKGVAAPLHVTPVTVGGYLASRATMTSISLESDLNGTSHALADSMRTLDLVSAIRWHFVLRSDPALKQSLAATQLVAQVSRSLNALLELYLDEEIDWELKMLPSS